MTKNPYQEAEALYEAILQLKNVEECRSFFEDLCTIKEMMDMTQRLEVAKLLDAGKNYQEICRATGASTATICRVNKCLNYGSLGYRTVIDRINAQKETNNDET